MVKTWIILICLVNCPFRIEIGWQFHIFFKIVHVCFRSEMEKKSFRRVPYLLHWMIVAAFSQNLFVSAIFVFFTNVLYIYTSVVEFFFVSFLLLYACTPFFILTFIHYLGSLTVYIIGVLKSERRVISKYFCIVIAVVAVSVALK